MQLLNARSRRDRDRLALLQVGEEDLPQGVEHVRARLLTRPTLAHRRRELADPCQDPAVIALGVDDR
jgi:hypothetical protein